MQTIYSSSHPYLMRAALRKAEVMKAKVRGFTLIDLMVVIAISWDGCELQRSGPSHEITLFDLDRIKL